MLHLRPHSPIFSSDAVISMLDSLAHENGLAQMLDEPKADTGSTIPERYQILIEFDNEVS